MKKRDMGGAEKIGQTAKFVAHLRSFSDVEFAGDIARAFNTARTFNSILKQMKGVRKSDLMLLAPNIEARHKGVDYLVQQAGNKNVLEIAAGLSPRGLATAIKNPNVTYIETDLPNMIDGKVAFCLDKLDGKRLLNHTFMALNAMSAGDFMGVRKHLKDGPVTVVSEGLFPYLSHSEKVQVAWNVNSLLRERGGVWITPDTFTRERYEAIVSFTPELAKMISIISGVTDRDLLANAFDSLDSVLDFFGNLGFRAEMRCLKEIAGHIMTRRYIEPENQFKVTAMLGSGRVLELEVK
jgi:O-methyltransferase involved in polyketide biosynthesis